MSRSVTVTVPARLHLGFLDIDGTLGRRFGSMGLSIERPVTRLTLRRAPRARVEGREIARASRHLAAMQEALGLAGGYHLDVEATCPPHSGLGSGTQIALAVACALRKLNGLPLDVRGDAERLGRGKRSGVGIGLFQTGGAVLDGGRTEDSGPAPILARLPFPEDWRILTVQDTRGAGLHGEAEIKAFAELPPFPPASAAHLCHLVVMRALPGLIERDLASFGAAITEIQEVVGDWFAPAQGGRFASPRVAELMAALAKAGAKGMGQSSWGPTGFAFADSPREARRLKEAVAGQADRNCLVLDIVRANNRGASIVLAERAGQRLSGEPVELSEGP